MNPLWIQTRPIKFRNINSYPRIPTPVTPSTFTPWLPLPFVFGSRIITKWVTKFRTIPVIGSLPPTIDQVGHPVSQLIDHLIQPLIHPCHKPLLQLPFIHFIERPVVVSPRRHFEPGIRL
ncbi:hypothetical protein HanIR_Chr01g0049541 [Helianthus annuus]|nr:hypothetical protein HanIR_Chr01g0049541 [Helianthus annuus]